MTASPRFSRRLTALFMPPFRGLGIVVWLFFVLGFLLTPGYPIWHGQFIDSDDYTILAHTLDWIKGQSWFDLVQHRLNPPEGVLLHFARLTELPIGALITVFHGTGLSWVASATVTAALWPLVLLAGMLMALRWLAESFLLQDWTRLTAFVALFATPLMFQFSPGRIDHHGLSLLIEIIAFACAVRMMQEPSKVLWGAGAGMFLGLGQAVALETLPLLILMSACAGIWMMVEGRAAARAGLVFGLALYITSAVCLMLTHRPATWLAPDLLAYSIVYVLLAGSIAVCCASVALAAQSRHVWLRYVTGPGLGLGMAMVFFMRFPQLLAGPYGAMDKEFTTFMFEYIREVQPLTTSPYPLSFILLPLFGLFAIIGFWPSGNDKKRFGVWLFLSVLLLGSYLISLFYIKRFAHFAVLFSIIPLTLFLQRVLPHVLSRTRGLKRIVLATCILSVAGPLPGLWLPALVQGKPFISGYVLFPAGYEIKHDDMTALLFQLNDPEAFGGCSRLIMNPVNEGAELLFRTKHAYLAALYHTNVSGLLDSEHFYAATDPNVAHKIITSRGVELVLMNKELAPMYHRIGKGKTTMADRLVDGPVPPWLKPVDMILPGSPYLLFQVQPTTL